MLYVKSKTPKKKAPYGLSAKTFRRPLRWAVDQDYENQLSQEERLWLSDFNDAYYGGNFSGTRGEGWSTEQKREAYLRSEHANNDVLGLGTLFGTVDPLDDHDPASPELEEPAAEVGVSYDYLEHPRYKVALQAWRKAVDETPAPTPSPSGSKVKVRPPSNEARRLKAILDGVVRLGRAGLL